MLNHCADLMGSLSSLINIRAKPETISLHVVKPLEHKARF